MTEVNRKGIHHGYEAIFDLLDRFTQAGTCSSTCEFLPTPEDTAALGSLLQQYGLDPSVYGMKGTKGLGNLLKELQRGEANLALSDAAILRVVEPVFISLRFTHNGVTKYCVEENQTFSDGRERKRNMLVAEKKRAKE